MSHDHCSECPEPAVWERVTQFAGTHPYCEKHAHLENDFNKEDGSTFWRKVADRNRRIQRRAEQLAAPFNDARVEAAARVEIKEARAAAAKRELRVQQLAKYILLAEIEREGVAIPDMPGVIDGSFRAAELFDEVCEVRMKKVTP